MREKRGPLARTVGAVTEGLAGAARRRQSEREGRVVLYDERGRPELVPAGSAEHAALVETADELLALVGRRADRVADEDSGDPSEGAPEAENRP